MPPSLQLASLLLGQGVQLVGDNQSLRVRFPSGPDTPPVDGAALDAELAEAGLELVCDWEDDCNIVRLNDVTYIEVTVLAKNLSGGGDA